jgi:hypothetical protein
MEKLTPVLCVEAIEPCLEFWVDRLGFARTAEVPEGDRLGFVMLEKGKVEVMLQSRASIQKDVPGLAQGPFRSSGIALYIEVADLALIRQAVAGYPVIVPERETFYGMREIGIRAPGDFSVVFAARKAPE